MTYRFYGDLAVWWPLISPPDEYTEEAAFAARLLSSASVPVHDAVDRASAVSEVTSEDRTPGSSS
ncbi:MAG TPA: hypothetical protein VK988_11875 [Acidimicrobiales bacterium]|nr:hypothetical protein [Acidimicrobiales bacterium]